MPNRESPAQITGERLTSLFRPRSVALVGASDKSTFSTLAYNNLVQFGFADRTDSALAPLPVSPDQARRMLDGLRGRAVLDGVRGAAPADVETLARVIARTGDLALALGDDLESLEINPLRVDGMTIEALDTVVTWARKKN
jgi:hypothetical protein